MPACDVFLRYKSREIAHGAETLKLDADTFRALEVMARRHGHVLTIREIGEALQGVAVQPSPTDVNRCIRRVMRKLNHTGCRHIVAVPGVGYAFFSHCER